MMRLGLVPDEKFTKIISNYGSALRVDIRVIVLPEPGGPHNKNGLCSESHEQRIYWCLKVSTVGMITSASVTF